MLRVVELDLGARILGEQHRIARFDVERRDLAVLPLARADGDDFALLRLFLRGIGNDQATLGLLLFREPLHDHSIMKWSYFLSHDASVCELLAMPIRRRTAKCHSLDHTDEWRERHEGTPKNARGR